MWSESDNLYSRNESKVYSVMVNERNIWLMSRYTSGCVQGPKNGSISFILGFGAEEGNGLGSTVPLGYKARVLSMNYEHININKTLHVSGSTVGVQGTRTTNINKRCQMISGAAAR